MSGILIEIPGCVHVNVDAVSSHHTNIDAYVQMDSGHRRQGIYLNKRPPQNIGIRNKIIICDMYIKLNHCNYHLTDKLKILSAQINMTTRSHPNNTRHTNRCTETQIGILLLDALFN